MQDKNKANHMPTHDAISQVVISKQKLEEARQHYLALLADNDKDFDSLFALAEIYYQQVDFDKAQTLLNALLSYESMPYKSACLLYLGKIHQQMGLLVDAINYFQKSLQMEPDQIDCLMNLAKTYEKNQELSLAISELDKVRKLIPDSPLPIVAKGDIYRRAKKFHQAIEEYNSVLLSHPSHVACLIGIATSYRYLKQFDEAEVYALKAQALVGNSGDILNNLALINMAQGKLDKAEKYFEALIAIDIVNSAYLNNAGVFYKQKGNFDKAIQCFESALASETDSVVYLNNLGVTLQAIFEFDRAKQCHEKAFSIAPNYTDNLNNLGLVYKALGEYEKSLECYNRAVKLDPKNHDFLFNRSFINLLFGHFKQGWQDYESRKYIPAFKKTRDFIATLSDVELWDGEQNVNGKIILIVAERGYGDFIHFVRYGESLKRLGAKVILICPKALQSMFYNSMLCDGQFYRGMKIDYYIPLMSLANFFHGKRECFQFDKGYLKANTEKVASFRDIIKKDSLNIGLVWAGSSIHSNDINRSMHINDMLPILNIEGPNYYSLQVGERENDVSEAGLADKMVDLSIHIKDFSDTAAFITLLDLVVSVDTSSIHLTGALNKPGYLMLPKLPSWQWLLDRDSTPWYPSLTLFRQVREKDWSDVVRNVVNEIKRLL